MMNKKKHLNIYRALSELFLDTEIEDYTFDYIARTIFESGLSLAEVEEILWYEVYPVLQNNLKSTAGVWDGWSDLWLLENLPAPIRPSNIDGNPFIIKEIKICWQKVILAYENQSIEQRNN